MPDTQFLHWGAQGSVNPAPQEASFRYIIENSSAAGNIVFMAHLGDLTEDGEASSFQYVNKAFGILDSNEVAYSVLAGNDVYMHITNYQNRYFGGGGMIRLYHFDLERGAIDIETISPWILAEPPEQRNVLAAQEARLVERLPAEPDLPDD